MKKTVCLIGCVALLTACGTNAEDREVSQANTAYGSQITQALESPSANLEAVLQDEATAIDAVEEAAVSTADFSGFYQFTAIPLGTSIDNAVNNLGNPTSTLTTEMFGSVTETKTWITTNLFRLSTTEVVTFTDGIATSIMSTADSSSNISASDLNRVSNGMSEAEVFEILGPPYSVTIVEMLGMTSITVMWINANFSSGTVTFTNGAVSSIMAMGL